MTNPVHNLLGNRTRIRVCGLLADEQGIVMVNHKGLYDHDFWIPPGGGIDFGEAAINCLVREFHEETGLKIEVGNLSFICEFIKPPLHAIELFFKVKKIGGELQSGFDPEFEKLGTTYSLVVGKLTWTDISRLKKEELHGSFNLVSDPSKIVDLRGYLKL